MSRRDEVFPSKYLKESDLNGKPINVEIALAAKETLKTPAGKEQDKVVLSFKGAKKSLPLNMCNFDSVAEIAGTDDWDQWPGVRLQLYPWKVEMHGEMKPCVRIRSPEQGELRKLQAPATPPPAKANGGDSDMDKPIPF
jgi:hypothetical protein